MLWYLFKVLLAAFPQSESNEQGRFRLALSNVFFGPQAVIRPRLRTPRGRFHQPISLDRRSARPPVPCPILNHEPGALELQQQT